MFKHQLVIFIICLCSVCLFGQDHHYHAICVDSLQVPYEYNCFKQNTDGSITFFQISSTLNEISFNKFTLSYDLVFSGLETFYTDQVSNSNLIYYSNLFGNEYFKVSTTRGSLFYIFRDEQLIRKLDSHIFLPIDASHIVYNTQTKYYKLNIITHDLDSLSLSPIYLALGSLPYNNQQFLIKYNSDLFHQYYLVINNDLTIADTVTVNESSGLNDLPDLNFNPQHVTINQLGGYIIMLAYSNNLEGNALVVFNDQNEIVYILNDYGTVYDIIVLDQSNLAFLYNNESMHVRFLMKLVFGDIIYNDVIPTESFPYRQFIDPCNLIVTLFYSNENVLGISELSDFPNYQYSGLTEQYSLDQAQINYWNLADSCFLIDFNTGSSHYIKKFRIIGTTDNHDALAVSKPVLKCYPNPFHSSITIEYLSNIKNERTQIYIYNIKGQLVRSYQSDKNTSIKWDGKDKYGRYVSEGVYLVNLQTNKESKRANKILFLK